MNPVKEKKKEKSMLSIVIPAWNEEDGILEIMKRVNDVKAGLKEVGVDQLELIVVDDGSDDRTASIVEAYAHARLVRHATNRGYGAALKSGFKAANGSLLAFLDADGTYPPEYFPELCKAAMNGADLVVGSRRSGKISEMPLVRKIGNFLWSNLVTLISNHRVIDPASGMRVFPRESLEKLYPLPDGLNFTPVMSTRAVHEGLVINELPIPYSERQGDSKLSVVHDGIRFLQTILWTAMNYNPVRIFGAIGVGLIGISLLIGGVFLVMRLSGVTVLGPLGVVSAYLALVVMILGVDIFALGTTFNYLVSLFHKRPVRQGLFGRPIFKTPLDRQFWWIGLLGMIAGIVLSLVSSVLAFQGWAIERLWFYLLSGTLVFLVGAQLIIFWIVLRVLDELSTREIMIEQDMIAGD